MSHKIIIYQVLPRLFGNVTKKQTFGGTIHENGVGKFAHFTREALREIRNMGATHIWYTGILEHATCTDYNSYGIPADAPEVVKGRAGSPYAVKDYYDVDPDLADDVKRRMEEWEAVIRRTHEEGLKVIIDFVPNHVARAYYSDNKPAGVTDFGAKDNIDLPFSAQNNFYYLSNDFIVPQQVHPFGDGLPVPEFHYTEHPAKATGNDCFLSQPSVNDWYETVKLNYGIDSEHGGMPYFQPIPDTWRKMLDIILFWAEKKVDGFRCDMAEMAPVAFWNWLIPQIKAVYPNLIFIAEIYNPNEYRNYIFEGKFDYLYDKVGLYDTLRTVVMDEKSTNGITACWQQTEGIGDRMLYFMENHDEQRIASRFFAGDARKALPAMLVSTAFHQGPAMLYFGQEVGESAEGATGFSGDDGRTSIFDYTAAPEFQKWVNDYKFDGEKLSSTQKQLRTSYMRLLQTVGNSTAIAHGDFYDLMWANAVQEMIDSHRLYVFLRHAEDEKLLCIAYFGEQKGCAKVVVPEHAFAIMQWDVTKQYEATNLLADGDIVHIQNGVAAISLEAYDYKIYKLTPIS